MRIQQEIFVFSEDCAYKRLCLDACTLLLCWDVLDAVITSPRMK